MLFLLFTVLRFETDVGLSQSFFSFCLDSGKSFDLLKYLSVYDDLLLDLCEVESGFRLFILFSDAADLRFVFR